ncbi:MAG: molybdate ABC transporter substrate-binding protein [Aeromicrobium sp.]
MKRLTAILVAAVLLTSLAACSDNKGSTKAEPRTLSVYAAASLKGSFTKIGKQFEDEHEAVTVEFSFAGSSDLAAQILQGAPADVFAPADTENMDKVAVDQLLAAAPVYFASNTLEIATPPDNPAGIKTLTDLAEPGTKVVLCAPEVPCGSAAQTVENASGADIKPVSEEASVTDVLNKVVTGEADAGLVYVTDVLSAGDKVNGIKFPESSEAVNTYPIASLKGSKDAKLATQFVDLVTSDKGQGILADAGFAKP